MVVLVGVSVAALDLVLPISIAITVVLAVVVLSYRQTVRAYETSGGAYVVGKDNLGRSRAWSPQQRCSSTMSSPSRCR